MRIGDAELKYGLMLAPMAGFSDRAMRYVCHSLGAELCVTEMVSAKAVTYGDKKTCKLACIRADEGPVSLQIFGKEPDVMARAAYVLSRAEGSEGAVAPVSIDINMGCPVEKVFKNGEGSALMRDPELIYRIVKAVKGNIDIPVTVKLRSGVNAESINAVECALAAESGGASLICVHGRTRVQMYSGNADRQIIKEVKKSVNIPVIANGDVNSGEDALGMLRDTGADGLAIGRGAVGNPFIFEEIISALEGKEYTPPSLDGRISTALRQLWLAVEDKGERIAIPEARKQIAMYLKAFKGAARIRSEINGAVLYSEVEEILLGALDEQRLGE